VAVEFLRHGPFDATLGLAACTGITVTTRLLMCSLLLTRYDALQIDCLIISISIIRIIAILFLTLEKTILPKVCIITIAMTLITLTLTLIHPAFKRFGLHSVSDYRVVILLLFFLP